MPPAEDQLKGRSAATGRAAATGRDAQRQQTRERVYAAALSEFKRTGRAAADVADIAAAAGVARGTFYFHYPPTEHVLAELERHEEARLVAQLAKAVAQLEARCGPPSSSGPEFLTAALNEVVRLLTAMERRVGKTLFREMLGLHFSSRRPDVLPGSDKWTEYPIMTVVVEAVERARERGEVHPDASALPTAQLFMIGLYAMLIASHDYPKAARAEILDNFVATVLRGVSPR